MVQVSVSFLGVVILLWPGLLCHLWFYKQYLTEIRFERQYQQPSNITATTEWLKILFIGKRKHLAFINICQRKTSILISISLAIFFSYGFAEAIKL
jgi:hypothetical protein